MFNQIHTRLHKLLIKAQAKHVAIIAPETQQEELINLAKIALNRKCDLSVIECPERRKAAENIRASGAKKVFSVKYAHNLLKILQINAVAVLTNGELEIESHSSNGNWQINERTKAALKNCGLRYSEIEVG